MYFLLVLALLTKFLILHPLTELLFNLVGQMTPAPQLVLKTLGLLDNVVKLPTLRSLVVTLQLILILVTILLLLLTKRLIPLPIATLQKDKVVLSSSNTQALML